MAESNPSETEKPWAVQIFDCSPLKQEKFKQMTALLGETQDKLCLDIGSDNGVISYLLRQKGGYWHSVDLIPETVASIKELVQVNVTQIDGKTMPYDDALFDTIVIVDLLEHIETDKEFLVELNRILKPGGTLIVNVPNPKEGLLRKFRFMLGQTDEEHGHLRPGYDLEALSSIMPETLAIQEKRSYSRLFSVLVDTVITFGLHLMKGKSSGEKGTVVTGDDVAKMQKSLKIFRLLYPFLKITVLLDNVFPFLHGNMFISKWQKRS